MTETGHLPDEKKRQDPDLCQIHGGGGNNRREDTGCVRPVRPHIGEEPSESSCATGSEIGANRRRARRRDPLGRGSRRTLLRRFDTSSPLPSSPFTNGDDAPDCPSEKRRDKQQECKLGVGEERAAEFIWEGEQRHLHVVGGGKIAD